MLGKTFKQTRSLVVVEDLGAGDQTFRLALDRLHDAGVAVTEQSNPLAAGHVQIGPAVGVTHPRALPSNNGHRPFRIGPRGMPILYREDIGCDFGPSSPRRELRDVSQTRSLPRPMPVAADVLRGRQPVRLASLRFRGRPLHS